MNTLWVWRFRTAWMGPCFCAVTRNTIALESIQGRAEAWVRFLSGSHSGVIGLPLFETRALLKAAGIALG